MFSLFIYVSVELSKKRTKGKINVVKEKKNKKSSNNEKKGNRWLMIKNGGI